VQVLDEGSLLMTVVCISVLLAHTGIEKCVTKRRGGDSKEAAGNQAGNREAHAGNRAGPVDTGRHRTQQRRENPRWGPNHPELREATTTAHWGVT
jgi:hypothetical protein